MAYYEAVAILGLLLCTSVCAGELRISGNEPPLYIGVSRTITCTWTGEENVTMYWYSVEHDLRSSGNSTEQRKSQNKEMCIETNIRIIENSIELNTRVIEDENWDGKYLKCKALTTTGDIKETSAHLEFKECEFKNITASKENPTAGDSLTLICVFKCDEVVELNWTLVSENDNQIELNSFNINRVKDGEKYTLNYTFSRLLTSNAGRYRCGLNDQDMSPRPGYYLLNVTIPTPIIHFNRDSNSTILFTGNDFVLTANIEPLDSSVDTLISFDSMWYKKSYLIEENMTVSEMNSNQTYNTSIYFTPLKSNDSGTYLVHVIVNSEESEYVHGSSANASINIPLSLYVTINITYDPPAGFNLTSPYYKTNTFVTLTCQVYGASGHITYKWSSTGPMSLAANSSSQTLTKVLSPDDTGNHMCTVQDVDGNIGSNTTQMHVKALIVDIKMTYRPPADFTLPSPTYFRPATSVTLTCHVEQASEDVSYQWTSTNPKSFVVNSKSSIVRKTILTSDDAGNHTCTATDSSGNLHLSTIEMQMIGGGIFVTHSKNVNNKGVGNNSLVILKPSKCLHCKIDFTCYSNSSDSNNGYIIFPNGGRYYSGRRYYMEVQRKSPSGIQVRSYSSRNPYLEGVYTCQLPDSNGNILDLNIAYYKDDPRPPYIYDVKFTDLSCNDQESPFGKIEIKTRFSPPTHVIWKRDGKIVYVHPGVGGAGYKMTQVVTKRAKSEYSSFLLIHNAAHLPGTHTYTFNVTNYEGISITDFETNVKVEFRVTVSNMIEEAIHREEYNLKGSVSFCSKFAPELMQYVRFEWLDKNGVVLYTNNNFTVGNPEISGHVVTSKLTFTPMDFRHEGNYTCRAILQIPNEKPVIYKSEPFYIHVIDRTILQLKIGPLPHCSQWHKNKKFTGYLQHAINETIRDALKKNKKCDKPCKLYDPLITNIEYSCQTYSSCVIFRATLTGDMNTLTVQEMLAGLKEWRKVKGTFLYDDHTNAPIQLRVDSDCVLEVDAFSNPECKAKECLFDCHPGL